MDLEAATRRTVVVTDVLDCSLPVEEVADHAIMFLLAIVRRLLPSHEAIRAGTWDYRTALGAPRLRGKTFGVVGCGRIGTAAALRAPRPSIDVVFSDQVPAPRAWTRPWTSATRPTGSTNCWQQSDFVSLHCYLNETTRHLIDADALAKMRPGAILINTARGPIVDEAALLEALDSGHIAAAGLDVVEQEPLDNQRLQKHPRVLFTPHTAFYSVEGYAELPHQDCRGGPPPYPAEAGHAAEPSECCRLGPARYDRVYPGTDAALTRFPRGCPVADHDRGSSARRED